MNCFIQAVKGAKTSGDVDFGLCKQSCWPKHEGRLLAPGKGGWGALSCASGEVVSGIWTAWRRKCGGVSGISWERERSDFGRRLMTTVLQDRIRSGRLAQVDELLPRD